MKTTLRYTAVLGVLIVAVLTLQAVLRVRREIDFFRGDMRRDHRDLGAMLAADFTRIWRESGQAAALEHVRNANARDVKVRVRIVWLQDTTDAVPDVDSRTLDAVLIDRSIVSVVHQRDGEMQLYTYIPIDVPGRNDAALEIAEPLVREQAYTRTTILRTVSWTIALALLMLVLALVAGRIMVGKPIEKLCQKARRVGQGDLESPLQLARSDELGELALEMNAMCDRLREFGLRLDSEVHEHAETRAQLRHADRLSTVGVIAAGLIHELGTPMNVIGIHARLMADGDVCGEEVRDSAQLIYAQMQRMNVMIRQLLGFARARVGERRTLDIGTLVSQTIDLLEPLAHKSSVHCCWQGPEKPCLVNAIEYEIQQVLSNLLVNAIQAMPSGGEVRMTLETIDVDDNPCIRVSVCDQGKGIPETLQQCIFEPFFTTKPAGQGSGLGLSVSRDIAFDHGGRLVLEPSVTGACFALFLPLERGV